MAQRHNGIIITGMDNIQEDQWGHDPNQILLPRIISCTGIVVVTLHGLAGIHVTEYTPADQVATLCQLAAVHLGGNAVGVAFIGFINFKTPQFDHPGTKSWLPQTKEIVALLNLPAGTPRSAYVMGAESDLRVTRGAAGALTYALSNGGGWNQFHCLAI